MQKVRPVLWEQGPKGRTPKKWNASQMRCFRKNKDLSRRGWKALLAISRLRKPRGRLILRLSRLSKYIVLLQQCQMLSVLSTVCERIQRLRFHHHPCTTFRVQ